MKALNDFWKKNKSKFKNNKAFFKVMRLGFLISKKHMDDMEHLIHILEKENQALKEEIKYYKSFFNTKH